MTCGLFCSQALSSTNIRGGPAVCVGWRYERAQLAWETKSSFTKNMRQGVQVSACLPSDLILIVKAADIIKDFKLKSEPALG